MTRKWLIILGVVISVVVLALVYYAISPLFITIRTDDALPSPPAPADERMDVSDAVPLVDTPAHPAKGSVRIVRSGEQTFIRYENLKTINGPDIFVYLAKDLDAKEFVNLGRVKATEGNVNYEVLADVEVGEYRYVLIWCRMFGVLFNHADLSTVHN